MTAGVDPANAGQLDAWDAGEGKLWAENAQLFEDSLRAYDAELFSAANLKDGEVVLDVGCGTGSTTRQAARRTGSGTVLGVDLSTPMLTVAERLASSAGLPNALFAQADAQVHPFPPNSFDVVISRTGTMFFADRQAAFTNLAGAMRPGARLAILVWQQPQENEWFTAFGTALSAGLPMPTPPEGAPGPFSMADPGAVSRMLVDAGFTVPEIESRVEPMYFGPDVAAAEIVVLTALGWLLASHDESTRKRALQALRDDLAAHQTPDGVAYRSSAWLVTATRR